MPFYEVVASGFGDDDSTDDRVIWVQADDESMIDPQVFGVQIHSWSRLDCFDSKPAECIDFDLADPEQLREFRAVLRWFHKNTPSRVAARRGGLSTSLIGAVNALAAAERFVGGFEGDELQEGIDELLAGMRLAIADGRMSLSDRSGCN
ncbi:hypothetical protein [Stutzerimonas kunmingensis]|uniref:hypothetical protein n=1 Tax=Stutzerimonas kunmingensis TaxID=1211807 RepID=UPI0028A8CE08|nr:hypothetical protein [Stutzerimonas kunmingensis]